MDLNNNTVVAGTGTTMSRFGGRKGDFHFHHSAGRTEWPCMFLFKSGLIVVFVEQNSERFQSKLSNVQIVKQLA
jgi:hypothetical protein